MRGLFHSVANLACGVLMKVLFGYARIYLVGRYQPLALCPTRQITDELPDLLLSIARVKFCQEDRVSRLRCPRLSTHRCR